MQTIWLRANSAQEIEREPLPILVIHGEGYIPGDKFYQQARGEIPLTAWRYGQSTGLRTIHIDEGQSVDLFPGSGRHLTFIVSGQIMLNEGAGFTGDLKPGDVLFADEHPDRNTLVRSNGECRLLQLGVSGEWPEPDATPPKCHATKPGTDSAPNLKRMYKNADDRSYFKPFSELFSAERGVWSAIRPVAGFRFCSLADGTFIDWHPEVLNQLVFVMGGELELEVAGGSNIVESFTAGDVVLAEDRIGQGHIDRFRGLTHLAIVVLEDADLW